jgi:hypothetical protein
VVEGFGPRASRLERDRELLLDPLLPDKLGQEARPKRAIEVLVALPRHRS